jgi:para-nitrobenzyl esterase
MVASCLCLASLVLASCSNAASSPPAGPAPALIRQQAAADPVPQQPDPYQPADPAQAMSPQSTLDPATVFTNMGPIHGSDDGQVRRFLGVPYAAPPVGALRFTMPRPPTPWTTVRQANQTAPLCAQTGPDTTKPTGQEDCLYLNVFAPSKPPANPGPGGTPVMVWLHGGGFTLGSPNFTDGTQLADLYDVIVVAPAYRLGPIGFAGLESLADEDPHHSTGSYGLADQQLALHWVHDNAVAFGGDPANVTLFGESAGGWSVCAHLVSPRSAGLFSKAIIESGPCSMPLVTPEKSRLQSQQLAQAVGCLTPATTPADADTVDLDCLRAKPVDQLLSAIPDDGIFGLHGGARWSPTIDGWVLDRPIEEAMRAGAAAKVPVLIGWNADEGRLFDGLAYLQPFRAPDVTTYHDAFRTLTSGDELTAARIEQRYPLFYGANPNDAFSGVLGDAALKCPGRSVAVALAQQGQPVYVYSFAYAKATFEIPVNLGDEHLGAFHSAEVQFVFDQPIQMSDPVERRLALEMSARWAQFARTGDPNGAPFEADPSWPAFTGSDDPGNLGSHIVFDTKTTIGAGLDHDACAFWDSLDYSWAKR